MSRESAAEAGQNPFYVFALALENVADRSFAETPQLGQLSHAIVLLEGDAGRR